MKVKDSNSFQVHGWMVNKVGLRGNELLVYAIIYGITQDGETEFKGSMPYLTEFTGATKNTVGYSLNSLIEKKAITRQETVIQNTTYYTYKVIFPIPVQPEKEPAEKEPPLPEDVIKSKKVEFTKMLSEFVSKYGKEICNDFWYYWTQPNKTGTKIRWEAEDFFDIDARLRTFLKNQNKKQ